MSRREDVDTAYWNDPDVNSLTAPAKLVYLWSFTNDRTGMAGIFQVPKAAIILETGHDEPTVDAALTELQQARFLFYDGAWMWVRARIKRLNTRTVQMCKAVAKQVVKVPEAHEFRAMLLDQDGSSVWRSRDEVTTLNAEISATLDPHGSLSGGTLGSTPPGGNTGVTRMPPKWHRGEGKGEGPQGRGAGRGTRRTGYEPPAYEPDQQLRTIAAEHFADLDPVLVENTGIFLRSRGTEPTADAIAKALADVGASRGAA